MWRIGELLVQKKLITWEQLEEALQEQEKTQELTGEILVRKGYIARSLLFKALAEQHEMRFVDLKRVRINPKAVDLVPGSIAQKYAFLPVDIQDDLLIIAVDNPIHLWPEEELKKFAGPREIRPVLCLPGDLQEALQECYGKISQT